ncbi:hypothetical protein N790_04745 [Arenimonas malthae CC-JY-1]|uniref:Kynurenine 3-monooxygenase n=1 Tax=Arenimonas malthae CC-JY-1 TaxID=1384054 RepID=A0A091BER2_9GAMM|nr:NAD(P)/FAD-dependent oxidoreductase [Arenimonas malthae]KFN51188.1 hypothetical protein N790_04745 [Arenimonas malthae CC-JY-1]
MKPQGSLSLVGAGLAGALLATLLARRGWSVDVFEKRPDPRSRGYEGGRSINLALAERGLHALRLAGLQDAVMAQAVMMRGRMVHPLGGQSQLLRYGRDDSEVIWSVHRGRLNIAMLDAAEAAGARLHFNQRLESVDFDARRARFTNDHDRVHREHDFAVLLGCDGAGSGLRAAMAPHVALGESFEPLGHGYKELEIPPAADGGFRIEGNALHIWPRGGYMCIALPNTERTFTVTLFLPNEGEPSFATLPDLQAARAFFERDFADALPLITDFDADWTNNPTGGLGTLRLRNWRLGDRAVLLGDAAHAMVPFHGQGMNCAFEDCVALDRHIGEAADFGAAFEAFEAERRPNAEAIQAMALENYIEMRDRVDDADFLLQRALERVLADRHPGRFVPRYSMVSFLRTPYATAFERGKVQREILVQATRGLARLDEVDLAAADAAVLARLAPLE